MGLRDWEHCTLFDQRVFPSSAMARIGHGHITARQMVDHLPPGRFGEFFSFAVVRNPYHRFISFCLFFYKNSQRMAQDPLGTMKSVFQNDHAMAHVLMRPQHEFVVSKTGEILVSNVASFETIASGFAAISERFGAGRFEIEHTSALTHRPFKNCYDAEQRGMVHRFYERDFALFHYDVAL